MEKKRLDMAVRVPPNMEHMAQRMLNQTRAFLRNPSPSALVALEQEMTNYMISFQASGNVGRD